MTSSGQWAGVVYRARAGVNQDKCLSWSEKETRVAYIKFSVREVKCR